MTEQEHKKFQSKQLTKYNTLVTNKHALMRQKLEIEKEIDQIETELHDIEVQNYNSLWECYEDYKKNNSK